MKFTEPQVEWWQQTSCTTYSKSGQDLLQG